MKWQDKLAVLKMAGYEVTEVPEHKTNPKEYFRWVIEKDKDTDNHYYECDDDLEHLVADAWDEYEASTL